MTSDFDESPCSLDVPNLIAERRCEIREFFATRSRRLIPWRSGDPELRKALGRIDAAMEELLRLNNKNELDRCVERRLAKLLTFKPSKIDRDCSIELMDQLDQILIESGDIRYLAMELESEYNRAPGTDLNWADVHGEHRIHLFRPGMDEPGMDGPDACVAEARRRLASLRWARSDHYRRHRARQRLKVWYLWLFTSVLFGLVVALTIFMGRTFGYRTTLSVAAAGAVGATISGIYQLRDFLVRGSELRDFQPALLLQPLLGAASAMFVLLVLRSGVIRISGTNAWAKEAALGFVAGFSEPFFLGVIRRVTDL